MNDFTPEGVYPALPTPINDDGSINFETLEIFLNDLEDAGIHGVVPAGCTGHAATLGDMGNGMYDEHSEYVEFVADNFDGDIIAGTGMNSTQQTIDLASAVEDMANIDAHLVIEPYQNKPPQRKLFDHYQQIAESEEVEEPIVAYNVPSRTGVNIKPRTIDRIADIDGVIGVKEASNDGDQIEEYGEVLASHDDFAFGSGDDPFNHKIYEEGGTFTITVTGNVAPERTIEVWEAGMNEDYDRAEELNEELDLIHDAMFQDGDTNPVSVQYALNQAGYDFGTPREPLDDTPTEGYDEFEDETYHNQTQIEEALDEFGLLSN